MAAVNWLDNSDDWSTSNDWSGGVVPGGADDVAIAQGNPQITTDVGSVASLTVTAAGQASVDANGAIRITGSFGNLGTVDLNGSGAGQATLGVAGTAGFGTAGVLTGHVTLNNDALLEFDTGEITGIASGSALTLNGPQVFVADSGADGSNSALTGLSSIDGGLNVDAGASVATTGSLEVTGTLGVDTGLYNGGSHLAIAGTLTDSGAVQIGFGPGDGFLGLTASDLVTAAAFVDTSTAVLNMVGQTGFTAEFDVASVAGFGTAGVLTGQIDLYNDALLQFDSGEIATIPAGSELTLFGPQTFVADSGATGSNSALTGLSSIDGSLGVDGGASVTTTGDLNVTGTLGVDTGQDTGGSHLAIGGTLTDSGTVQIGFGPGDGFLGLNASDLVTAAGFVDTPTATLNIVGQTGFKAEFDVASLAGFGTAGVLTGQVNLYNDALLQFDGGQITSIVSGSELTLSGPQAFVADSGAAGSNSALTGLRTVAGSLNLDGGASLTTSGDLLVTGSLGVDTGQDTGGSQLAVGGTLINNSTVQIGFGPGDGFLGLNAADHVSVAALDNASSAALTIVGQPGFEAELDVAGPAGFGTAGVLTGQVGLYNDALLDFGSGQITSIAAGSALTLNGSQVYVADAGATGSNSALAGLSDVAGSLFLNYGASLTTSGDLTVDSTGTLQVDTAFYGGGTDLTVGGTLVNDGTAYIGFGPGDSFLGIVSSDDVSVQAIDNGTSAKLQLAGAGQTGVEATLSVAGAAGFGTAGVLTGEVDLYYDARLAFGSGSITSVASGAKLVINGADAQLIDTGTSGSDTALSALASNAGIIGLENGQVVTATGDFATSDFFGLDDSGQGSSFTVAGTFANSGTADIANGGIGAQTFLKAGALDNESGGQFNISGSGAATAVLVVQGTVTNAGTLDIYNGVSAEVGALDNSATLNLYGNAGAPTSLEVFGAASNSGSLLVGNAVTMNVTGGLTDTGAMTVGGTLDVAGTIEVTATGSVLLQGGSIITPGGASLTLDAGATLSGNGTVGLGVANDAAITAQGGTLDIAGAIAGSGSLAIANLSELELGGTDAETVGFGSHVGTLKLDDPSGFSGDITGLIVGDTLDLAGVIASSVTLSGSTLTVAAGQQTYSYQVAGSLAGNTFELEGDGQGGTDVVLGPPGPAISAPKTQTAFLGYPAVLGPLKIVDPDAGSGDLTATVSDPLGLLTANASGAGTVSGDGTDDVTLTGTLADLNAELASLAYAGTAKGTENVTIEVTDAGGLTASQQIAVTTKDVPITAPVLNAPAGETVLDGTPSALGNLSLSDPFSEATGGDVTLSEELPVSQEFPDGEGIGGFSGPQGPVIDGNGTSNVSITGTVSQINADINDYDFIQAVASFYTTANAFLSSNFIPGLVAGSILTKLASAAYTGVEQQYLILEAEAFSNEAAAITLAAEANTAEALNLIEGNLITRLQIVAFDPEISTADGLLYSFDAAGEFLLAKSTQPGNTFQVQVRLQPLNGSSSASMLTEVAAGVGVDRVTIGVGRADPVSIDGVATPMAVGETVQLPGGGGAIEQLSAETYLVAWNTGEVLQVTDNGSRLSLGVGLGSGEAPGTVEGLMGPDEGQANDFTLPNGTVLQQPLSQQDLYTTFANAWRVTQATSLFDYAPGQTTATFTNTNFPSAALTLSDFPASVVQQAQQAVAALGITDPNIRAAAELDYIATGGQLSEVEADASLFSGTKVTPAVVTPSNVAPALLGVLPDQGSGVEQAAAGTTPVTFDVYLTAAESSDTVVDYQVVDPGADDFTSAAFGGSFPAGSVTIVAGQTAAQFTVDLPHDALGTAASEELAVQISSPAGVPIAAATAMATVYQPKPGPPPLPQLEYLGNFGNFIFDSATDSYTLDLGAIQAGEPLPALQFGIVNAAGVPADQLGGKITWSKVAGYQVDVGGNTTSGASLPVPIAAGDSYQALTVTGDTGLDPTQVVKFGNQSETITFNPVDTNASGFTSPLTPITLTITDTLEQPGMVYSQAYADVHIISYNGLLTNFQGVGEFTLAKSRLANDSFDIQMRLVPWSNSSSVSTIQQAAVSLGTDKVTFDWTRTDPVYVDGVASSISQANPTLTLNGGSVTEISPSVFKVDWTTGETATFSEGINFSYQPYINIVDGVLGNVGPGAYSGLQGEDEGTQNDIQLADGTVLPQPVSSAELYGEYANSWRVSDATSLFNYGPGQSTASFTDRTFPGDTLSLASLPANVVANAATMVAAAGITDPGIAQAAELDFVATGDPSFITSAQNIQQFVLSTSPATVTPSSTPAAAVGVAANATKVTESSSGDTPLTFTAYLTGTESTDTTIDYTVIAPGAGDLGAAAFGGTLPSGAVTVAAGQTSAQFTIDVPQGALGTSPIGTLEVQVSSPDAVPIFAPTAQTEIVNSDTEQGTPAVAELAYMGKVGTFSFDAETSTYTLDLGDLTQGSAQLATEFAVINSASGQADRLGGTFSPPTGTGFTIIGNDLPNPLAAGSLYQGLYASVKTSQLGTNGMTLTFTPQDVNDSGYSAPLAPLTLKIVDTIVPPAQALLNTPGTIIFPNVRVGTKDSQAVSITNAAAQGAQSLDVSAIASASATVTGSIKQLAPGATDAGDVSVGVDTRTAGAVSGAVQLVSTSDNGAGQTSPLEAPDTFIDVFGSAYRPAAPQITAINKVIHVGDAGAAALTVVNSDPADNYSENLLASLAGLTGNVTPAKPGEATGEIAAGASDTSSLALAFSTAQAGTISGSAIVDLTSDGGTGTTSIDGLGKLALAAQSVPITVGVNNYAEAALAETSGGGTFTQTAGGYTLDLGTFAQGASPVVVGLAASNPAAGPADLLAGTFSQSGSPAFTNALANVSGIGAGQSEAAGTVTLSTSVTGSFSETITFDPTGSNASGYSAALAAKSLTITGTVVNVNTPIVTVSTNEPSIGASSPPATITFGFSKPVTGFDAADVTATGGSLGTITQSQTDPDQYTATFTPTPGFTGQGSVTVAAASYSDLNGDPGAGGGTSFPEDTVAPALLGVATSGPGITNGNGDLGAGSTVSIILTTDHVVNVSGGTPTLALDDGGVATFSGGSGTTSPTFTYTVAAGQTSDDLHITSVFLNGATITDAAGNPLDLSGAITNPPGTLQIDTTPPSVTIATAGGPTQTPTQTVTGTGEAGTTLDLFSAGDALPIAATQVGADGQWTAGITLASGDNVLTATDTDAAGNVGTSNTIDLNLAAPQADTTPPTVAITTTSGSTQTPTQTVAGIGEAGTILNLFDNLGAAPIATTEVGPDGRWAAGITLASGDNVLTATDTDAAGNVGTSNTIDLDLTSPPPVIPPPTNNSPPPSLSVTVDPGVSFTSPRDAILTGTVSDSVATAQVEVFANGGALDIGAASVNPDGTWTINDATGLPHQRGIYAVAADALGNSVSASGNYDLNTGFHSGIRSQPYTATQDNYTSNGDYTGSTFFERRGAVLFSNVYTLKANGDDSYFYSGGTYFKNKSFSSFLDVYTADGQAAVEILDDNDGSHQITGYEAGQTLHSIGSDTMTGGGSSERFVFTHGFGRDTITDFAVAGPGHDTLSLPSAEFTTMAQVLAATTMRQGDAVLHLNAHESITIDNVTKAQLKAHPKDFLFHA